MKATIDLRSTWTVLILAVVVAAASADDRRVDKSALVIMTFNAEFLWDGVAPEEGSADFPWKGSQTEAETHMAKVAAVIIAQNPDILNLVEVENLDALTTLNDKFLAHRGYRPYLAQGADTATGQDVALLTRIDPEAGAILYDNRKGHAGNLQKSVSKNYVAKFKIDQTPFALVGLHFLSQPNNQARRLQREAQADAIRSVAVELREAGYPPIILGDFNDYDGSPDSIDHINSTPVTSVLTLLRQLNVSDAQDDLLNAASFVPQTLRYTAFWDKNENGQVDPPGEFSSIDHILLPKELAQKVQTVEIPHTYDPREVTDHFPVVLRLKLAPNGPSSSAGVRIFNLLPNPPGDESINEAVTLKNLGTTPASLAGWKLQDLAKKAWVLDSVGTIGPGESKTIQRRGQPMALNNGGDTIDLVDPQGVIVQTVTYPATPEDELVFPSN